MATVWVECWKCDVCGHRWIKGEVWPDTCASSKCRSRRWNSAAKSAPVVDPVRGVSQPVERIDLGPVVETSQPSTVAASKPGLSDLRAMVAQLESKPVAALQPVPVALGPCPYMEYVGDIGETMACGKLEHSWKIPHGEWRRA